MTALKEAPVETGQFHLVDSSCEELTAEIAIKFRDMEPSPTERELDPKRVHHLRNKLDNGLAVTFHWAVAIIAGREYRMNGQHSSTLLASLEDDFPSGLYVHIDRYEVNSVDGLALLFRQFDDRKSARGPSDIAGAYQGLHTEIRDLSRSKCKIALQGVAYHQKNVIGSAMPSGDDLWKCFERSQYYSFYRWVDSLLSTKTRELKKVEVLAAMYATRDTNPEASDKFWELVAKGGPDDGDENHPATRLDQWLLDQKLVTDVAKKMKPANFYQACVSCYNAYVEGREVKRVRYQTTKGVDSPVAG